MSAFWVVAFGISRCTRAMNPEPAGGPTQRPVSLCLGRPRRFPSSRKVRELMIASIREGFSVIGESPTTKIKARIKGWRPFGGEGPTQDGRSD